MPPMNVPQTPSMWICTGCSTPENEIHRADQTQTCVQIIQRELLVHVNDRKRHEHQQRDYFLQDLELRQRQHGNSNTVGGHLQQILEQRDTPAHERGDDPWLRLQML